MLLSCRICRRRDIVLLNSNGPGIGGPERQTSRKASPIWAAALRPCSAGPTTICAPARTPHTVSRGTRMAPRKSASRCRNMGLPICFRWPCLRAVRTMPASTTAVSRTLQTRRSVRCFTIVLGLEGRSTRAWAFPPAPAHVLLRMRVTAACLNRSAWLSTTTGSTLFRTRRLRSYSVKTTSRRLRSTGYITTIGW